MRKMFNYPPLFLVLNLIVGILVAQIYPVTLEILVKILYFNVAILLLLILLRVKFVFSKVLEFVIFGCFTILIGSVIYSFSDIRNHNNFYGAVENKGEISMIIEIKEVLKPNATFQRFVGEVTQMGTEITSGKILFNVKGIALYEMEVGNRFLCRAELNPIQKPRNPNEFNYAAYLENQQIYHQVFVEIAEIQKLQEEDDSLFSRLANFRAELILKLSKKDVPTDRLAVMSALLLGERDYLTTDLKNAYINAGAIHILAISGLHIGILFLMLIWLLKPVNYLPQGKLISQLLIIVVLWLFAILAGLSASVVRAVTMFSFISIGQFLNRKNSIYQSLIASAFVLLLIRPRFLFEVGFQLSYTAVFAIVWLQPKLDGLWVPKNKILEYFWKLVTVSSAAQFGVLPLSLFYFHQFPSLFFVSNLVIIPLLGILLSLGIIVLVLVQFESSWDFFIVGYQWLIGLLNDFIRIIANLEQFVVKEIYWSSSLLIGSYLVLFIFFKYTEKRNSLRLTLASFAILGFYGILSYEAFNSKMQHEFIVFHKNRSSLMGILSGQELRLIGASKNDRPRFIDNFISNRMIDTISYVKEIPNIIFSQNDAVVVVDSLGLYNFKTVRTPKVLLQNSPKINLNRLIEVLNPSMILVDGSNYKSYVKRWKRSALKTKTPFYDTSQKGAYVEN